MRATISLGMGWTVVEKIYTRRKIRLIKGNAKCRHLKKFTCKGTLWQVFIRVYQVFIRFLIRMRSSLVVRASDCQCTSCNGPGFDPSIRRHIDSGIWGAADEAVLNNVRTKRRKKSPKKIFNHLSVFYYRKTYALICNWACKPGLCIRRRSGTHVIPTLARSE